MRPHRAFTLIELLVVIAILSILMALLVTGIQSAREAARRIQCQSNLRQIAVALLLHHENHNQFPSGGWNGGWLPESNRGSSPRQPGSWWYGILPYLEAGHVQDYGFQQPYSPAPGKSLWGKPLPVAACPTRGIGPLAKQNTSGTDPAQYLARSDYAANGGGWYPYSSLTQTHTPPRPLTLAQGDDPNWNWETCPNDSSYRSSKYSGVIYFHSSVNMAMVKDGASSTYLVGEKHMTMPQLADVPGGPGGFPDPGDQLRGMYVGCDFTNIRCTGMQPPDGMDPPQRVPARPDDKTSFAFQAFGSSHAAGFFMALCDGSVHIIDFKISSDVHYSLGSRNDGGHIPADALQR